MLVGYGHGVDNDGSAIVCDEDDQFEDVGGPVRASTSQRSSSNSTSRSAWSKRGGCPRRRRRACGPTGGSPPQLLYPIISILLGYRKLGEITHGGKGEGSAPGAKALVAGTHNHPRQIS